MSSHFVTTLPTGGTCPRCRRLILTGWAEGLAARVDLTPLTPAGEVQALLDGRLTYTLSRTGLIQRDAGRITGGHLRGPVVPAHRCGRPMPASCHAPPGPVASDLADHPTY